MDLYLNIMMLIYYTNKVKTMSSISEKIKVFLNNNSKGKFAFNRTDAYATNNFKILYSPLAKKDILIVKDTNFNYLLNSKVLSKENYQQSRQILSMAYFFETKIFSQVEWSVEDYLKTGNIKEAHFEIVVENDKEYEYSFILNKLIIVNDFIEYSVVNPYTNTNSMVNLNENIMTRKISESILNVNASVLETSSFDKVYDSILKLYEKELMDKLGISLSEVRMEDIVSSRLTQLFEMVTI